VNKITQQADFKFWATILNEDRARDFDALFGTHVVPITNPMPFTDESARLFYRMDTRFLTPEMQQKTVEYLAQKLNMNVDAVEKDFWAIGVSILADNCLVQKSVRFLM
jgi:hypothetical protein